MFWLRRKKRPIPPLAKDPVVEEMKQRTHTSAQAAKMNADRLNRVFKQNHITLNIVRAAGGGK